MTKRIFLILATVMLLLGAFAMNVAATDELADVYVATTGIDTNAGTAEAPVLSLNKALELVKNGGTVHIVDSFTAPAGFVWDNHNKDVTITGGKLDLSAGYIESTDGGAAFYYYAQGDAVTYDDLELVLADDMYYFANGFRLQINENVTVVGKDLQLYGGGFKETVAGTNMKLLGGSYLCDDGYASIYGGSYKADVNGDVNLYIGKINPDYTTSHYGMTRLYGGCYNYSGNSYVRGNVNLTIAGGNVDRIVSVSHTACIVTGNVNTQMTGGSAYSLSGGSGGDGNAQGDIQLTMTGGTVAQVFGANEGGSYTGNVTVKLQGGTITRRFFGGCYNNYDGAFSSANHVTGNVDVYIYNDMNFAWNTLESDAGFFAHSRYNPLFDDEVTNVYFMSAAAQTKHEGNLGAKNAGMRMVMGDSTAVADNVSVISADVEKWNVILGDDIGANFYVKLPDIAPESVIIKVTVADRVESHDLLKLTPNAEGLYLISVNVAAAQMTEQISLQLVIDGLEGQAVTYTIAQYADTILKGDYTDKAKNMVKYMLHYGAAAQEYFDVNTDNLANTGYELEYTAQLPAEYPQVAVEGSLDGVRFYGASLRMDNQIAVRYYFTANSMEGVSFAVSGKDCTTGEKDGMFYVEIAGINPYEYADAIVLSAVKGEESLKVTYSPLTYIVRMSNNGSSEMKALVNALYGYHEAALAYLDSRSAYIELPAVTGGSVETDKLSCIAGETIILTVKPDQCYNLTDLTIKKDGEVFATFETDTNGGTYSFATGAAGVYTVEATFVPDHMISAPNTDYVLRSPSIKYAEGSVFLERGVADGVNADDPMIDTLLTQAPGEFNKSGEEWLWIAYKISVPAHGTYSLGLTINDARDSAYKMPMVINHEVYTLNFTAKKQTVTTDVTLPAGEHIVTVFWPMPATASEALAEDWQNYIWANVQTVIVDYALTVCSAPTAGEVETYVVPNKIIQAIDDTTVLWSAAIGNASGKYLEFNSRDAVKADLPYIDSLRDDAPGQFNKSGEEWGWFAYKVTAPADGTYTMELQMQNCRNAPYDMPLYVNEQVYTLSYSATGRQSASVDVTLSVGEHTVVIFMPMPKNAASANGADYVDYPWANSEQITVDGLLSVSKPTTEEVEACFVPDQVISAVNAELILHSATINVADTYLGRTNQAVIGADLPTIENLLTVAPGQFNASGEEWNWFAYKVTVPAEGTYTLGVKTSGSKYESYKIPLVVDGAVYALAYTAKAQLATVDVTLPAGEHTVVMFMPLPAKLPTTVNVWNDYHWCNIESVTVDPKLTVSKPTVEETEAAVVADHAIATIDGTTVLWSAAMGDASGKYLEFNSRDAVKADIPYIDSLFEDAIGEFNKAGEEWGWFAFKVTAPTDGIYKLGLQVQACKSSSYSIPLYVNGEIYTLSYTTAGAETAFLFVNLPAGEYTVVMLMPMPENAEMASGEDWIDYPWCNPQTILVDAGLTVSLPAVEEVEACFPVDQVISAVDAEQILHSATIQVADTYLGRTDQAVIGADLSTIENLYIAASGQFNKSGEEWNWFAYKVTAPKDGTYTMGVQTSDSKYASYQIPLCVNGQVYALQYTEKAQLVTAEVALTAGEHTVVVFMPLPASSANITNNVWNDYHWCNIESIMVDGLLSICKPSVEEVEACFAMETYSAPDTSYILRSAAVKYVEGNAYVERGSTTGVHEDTPRFDTLLDLAPGNFNESGKEWLWIAYKISIPTDGTYTLGLTTAGSKYASYKMPMVVNGQVYTLSFTEKSQTVTTEVELPAGEHVVTVFWPMPEDESKVDASNANNYIWCNIKDVVVDHSLAITAPTVAEVEACFPVAEVPEEGGLENGGTLVDDYVYGEIS